MKIPDWLPVYGDTKYRNKKCPSETAEQITFFNWLRLQFPAYGVIALHPRNEGKRTHHIAKQHKAEGMAKGASDIIIPGAPTFVCEMKRVDHTTSRWEDGQIQFLETCKDKGAFVCLALGADGAINAFEAYRKIAESARG